MRGTTFPRTAAKTGVQAQAQAHIRRVLVVGDVVEVAEGEDRLAPEGPVEAQIVLEAGAVQFLIGLPGEVSALGVELEEGAEAGPFAVFPGAVGPPAVPKSTEGEFVVGAAPRGAADEGPSEVEDMPGGPVASAP